MNQQDQLKVMRQGFVIIRKEYGTEKAGGKLAGGKIKVKTNKNPDWVVLEKDFSSNYTVDQRMKELLKSPLTIED